MGEFYNTAGKAFLHFIELADFNFGSKFAMQHINAGQRDVFPKDRRAG